MLSSYLKIANEIIRRKLDTSESHVYLSFRNYYETIFWLYSRQTRREFSVRLVRNKVINDEYPANSCSRESMESMEYFSDRDDPCRDCGSQRESIFGVLVPNSNGCN